jgi:uncharacterized protein
VAPTIVVSNTTPLIALAWLKRLDLLPTLFGRVHIPLAVLKEVTQEPTAVGAAELKAAAWLITLPVADRLAVDLLMDQLDYGESEAIVLAHEQHADLLLMDERRGRRRARQSGLTVAGTLAVLIRARQLGLIDQLRPLLDALQRLPFHMSDELINDVLQRVGE